MAKVTLMWLVAVKVYGVRPSRFVTIININMEMTNGVTPLGDGAKSRENSAWSFLETAAQGSNNLLLRTQTEGGVRRRIAARLTQLGTHEDDGSKTEKMLVIIIKRTFGVG